jgi:hypothetical protein
LLNVHNPDPARRGNVNHIGLGVTSVKECCETLVQRGSSPRKPLIGRDGKRQVALVSPDLTRVERMEFEPVETPCCRDGKTPALSRFRFTGWRLVRQLMSAFRGERKRMLS